MLHLPSKSLPLSELFRSIEWVMNAAMQIGRSKATSAPFQCEIVQVLLGQTSGAVADDIWVTVTSTEQLFPGCQLFAFQPTWAASVHGTDDAKELLPPPIAVDSTGFDNPQLSPPRRRFESASPTRRLEAALSSPRTRLVASSTITASLPSSTLLSEAAILRCAQGVFARLSGPPIFDALDTTMLRSWLQAVGVDFSLWDDPDFDFLASAALTAAHRPTLYWREWLIFAARYPATVALLAVRYCKESDIVPPVSPVPQLREQSPLRVSTPSQRQRRVSERLYSGLACIATAKDRKLNLYDPTAGSPTAGSPRRRVKQ